MKIMMILLYIYIYIYREKKVFYNIEGQLRDFQDHPAKKLALCANAVLKAPQLNICTRAKREETPSKHRIPAPSRCAYADDTKKV
jgi:hypothetical protein